MIIDGLLRKFAMRMFMLLLVVGVFLGGCHQEQCPEYFKMAEEQAYLPGWDIENLEKAEFQMELATSWPVYADEFPMNSVATKCNVNSWHGHSGAVNEVVIPCWCALRIEHYSSDGKMTDLSEQIYPPHKCYQKGFKFAMYHYSPRDIAGPSFTQWQSCFPIAKHVDFEKGLYRIYYKYSHPKSGKEKEDKSLFVSIVSDSRMSELRELFENNPKLALASYQFQHRPLSEMSDIRPIGLDVIDKHVKVGMTYEEILWLLGSPDLFGRDFLESWSYSSGLNRSYFLTFKDGRLVDKRNL